LQLNPHGNSNLCQARLRSAAAACPPRCPWVSPPPPVAPRAQCHAKSSSPPGTSLCCQAAAPGSTSSPLSSVLSSSPLRQTTLSSTPRSLAELVNSPSLTCCLSYFSRLKELESSVFTSLLMSAKTRKNRLLPSVGYYRDYKIRLIVVPFDFEWRMLEFMQFNLLILVYILCKVTKKATLQSISAYAVKHV
jgi:hypothetical protein